MEIIFKNVDYIYQPNTPFQRQALFDINLVIPHGKITSIIGNTGSGKSTLIKQINGLLKPTNGEISLGDKVINNNINSHDLLEIRRNVGMLFQFSERQLFSSTVAEDIKFGGVNYHLSPDELEHNFTDIINLLEIDNSLLNKSPLELSGGQMRKIALAGVLIYHPKILILDEPTIGLDGKTHLYFMNVFKQLQEKWGLTIIMVTHQMEDVVNYSDNVVFMNGGKVFVQGDVKNVFKNNQQLMIEKNMMTDVMEFALNLYKKQKDCHLFENLPLTIDELIKKIKLGLNIDE